MLGVDRFKQEIAQLCGHRVTTKKNGAKVRGVVFHLTRITIALITKVHYAADI